MDVGHDTWSRQDYCKSSRHLCIVFVWFVQHDTDARLHVRRISNTSHYIKSYGGNSSLDTTISWYIRAESLLFTKCYALSGANILAAGTKILCAEVVGGSDCTPVSTLRDLERYLNQISALKIRIPLHCKRWVWVPTTSAAVAPSGRPESGRGRCYLEWLAPAEDPFCEEFLSAGELDYPVPAAVLNDFRGHAYVWPALKCMAAVDSSANRLLSGDRDNRLLSGEPIRRLQATTTTTTSTGPPTTPVAATLDQVLFGTQPVLSDPRCGSPNIPTTVPNSTDYENVTLEQYQNIWAADLHYNMADSASGLFVCCKTFFL